MTSFQDIKDILDKAVGGANKPVGGPHGAFWRNITEGDFIKKKIKVTVDGQEQELPIIEPSDGEKSNLVRALRGTGLFDGNPFPRMPKGRPAVPTDSVSVISRWIDLNTS
jgi:hypothetical protein